MIRHEPLESVDVSHRRLPEFDHVIETGTRIADRLDRLLDAWVDHDRARAAVVESVFEGLRAEEDREGNRDRAELPDGEMGDRIGGLLRNHDRHPVARFDPELAERRGEPVGPIVELAVAVGRHRPIVGFVDQCGLIGLVFPQEISCRIVVVG